MTLLGRKRYVAGSLIPNLKWAASNCLTLIIIGDNRIVYCACVGAFLIHATAHMAAEYTHTHTVLFTFHVEHFHICDVYSNRVPANIKPALIKDGQKRNTRLQ